MQGTARFAFLAFLFLLAGCSDPAQAPEPVPSATPAPADCPAPCNDAGGPARSEAEPKACASPCNDTATHSVTSGRDATVTAVFGPVGYMDGENGGNCIVYWAEEVQAVSRGWFEAAWNATAMTQETLRLAVSPSTTGDVLETRGPSPLRVEFGPHEVERRLAMYVTPVDEPGAIIDQRIRFTWHLEYTGAATLSPPPSGANCG